MTSSNGWPRASHYSSEMFRGPASPRAIAVGNKMSRLQYINPRFKRALSKVPGPFSV
jgi:hypothetical protein